MTATGPALVPFAADSVHVAEVVPAANVEPRRNGRRADLLVLHYTGMKSAAGAVAWLARGDSKVSCHYVVDLDGRITQLVAEALRAWHAGVSSWQGETDINSCSIGIEIQNPGHEMGYHPFPASQMAAVAALAGDIVARHRIPAGRVLAHSDVAPQRKIDPGERFDWRVLADQGVGLWVPSATPRDGAPVLGPDAAPASIRAAQAVFRRIGYGVESDGVWSRDMTAVVTAFQRHWRQARVDGRLDLSTLAAAERVASQITTPLEAST